MWLSGLQYTAQGIYRAGISDADIDAPEAWRARRRHSRGRAHGVDGVRSRSSTPASTSRRGPQGQVRPSATPWAAAGASGVTDGTGHGTTSAARSPRSADVDVGIVGVLPEAKRWSCARSTTTAAASTPTSPRVRYAANTARASSTPRPAARVSRRRSTPPSSFESVDQVRRVRRQRRHRRRRGRQRRRERWPCTSPNPTSSASARPGTRRARDVLQLRRRDRRPVRPGVKIFSSISFDTVEHREPEVPVFRRHLSGRADVSGVAALMLQANPQLRAQQLREVIIDTADDKPAFDGYSVSGGRLNAAGPSRTCSRAGSRRHRRRRRRRCRRQLPDGRGARPVQRLPARPRQRRQAGRDRQLRPEGRPDEADADRDGIGDVCDSTRAARTSTTTVSARSTIAARPSTARGARLPPAKPAVIDRDHDGKLDTVDGCPNEPVFDLNGCRCRP